MVFWRDNERWLRENGKEFRLLDLAPNLERMWLMEHQLSHLTPAQLQFDL